MLVEGYRSVVQRSTTLRSITKSVGVFAESFRDTAGAMRYSVASGLMAFRLIVKLGLLDRERREFWRFFRRALVEHRGQFAQSSGLPQWLSFQKIK